MPRYQCYHCKEWIEQDEPHDCWTRTVDEATADLTDELREAWERLHEAVLEFGAQRIYASHKSIMFARQHCYAFVRPKRSFLELVMFLGRRVKAPHVRRAEPRTATKIAHTIHLRHRDEVEAPITDWMKEAYDFAATPTVRAKAVKKKRAPTTTRKAKRR